MLTVAMNGTGTDDIAQVNDTERYHEGALKRQHQLEIVKTLGEGTHGKVVLATDPVSMQQVHSICIMLHNYAESILRRNMVTLVFR